MNGTTNDYARRVGAELLMDMIALVDVAVLTIAAAALCSAALAS